jgi:hypothetical protein
MSIILEQSGIDKDYFTIDEVLNEIVIMENELYTYKPLRKNLMKQRENIGGYFQYQSNDGKIIEGFEKKCVKTFLERYMRKNIAVEYLNLTKTALITAVKKYGFTEVRLGHCYENIFLLKSEVENYKNNISLKNSEAHSRNVKENWKKKVNVDGYYNSNQVREILKLSHKAFSNCLDEGTLVPSNYGVNNMPLFKIEYIEERVKYQHHLFYELNEKYYTSNKINELFVEQIQSRTRKNLTKIVIPQILKGMFDRNENLTMYLKEDVDKEVSRLQIVRAKKEISFDNPIQSFYFQVKNIYHIKFNHNVQNTSKYWFQFIEQKISNSTKNDYGMKMLVSQFVKCTSLLSLKLDKELYSYTSNQINLLLLNPNIVYKYRCEYYQFLKVLNEQLEELNIQSYNVSKLIKPERHKSNVFEIEDVVYVVDDFLELIEYCSNTYLHKVRAISDVERYLDTLDSYRYDSMWLYVIIHLNNGWRHDTVITQTPRIDLSNTRVDGLNWLKYNDLTFEEAKDIVYQVGRKIINANKNKAEGNFILSDKLTIPFATAICINELRTQKVNPNNPNVIDFGTEYQKVSERTHNNFFQDFLDGNFKLSSLKMNRTYLSAVHKLLEDNYDAVKASQFARSHKTVETTNIYIKFSREQIDELTSQLFARDNFGYINQIFTELIFEKEYDRETETNMMIAINKSIGDTYKIEATSGFINNVITERQEIERMIRSMTFEEVLKTYRLLLMNELPSKQKHYQCLFSKENCRRPELKHCEDCQFSIPNVYAIINLLEKYISQIIRLQNDFNHISDGQKKKLANQFYLTRLQLKEAEDKFGADKIYGFLDGGREVIRQLASSNETLKTVKDYITLK